MLDYDIVAVEEAVAPAGIADGKWHRYIIANRINSITGYRSGSRREVTEYARACVGRLNAKLSPHGSAPAFRLGAAE